MIYQSKIGCCEINKSQVSEIDRLYNNVYGTLIWQRRLGKLCEVLRYSLGISESEGYVYKSQYNGQESLKIKTDIYDLETQKSNLGSKYSFTGAIAGSDKEVIVKVKILADILIRSDCKCHFEIYDDNLEFIDEYPKKL